MPRYLIFAGVNGAGKTTLYHSDPKLSALPRVNMDEIVRSIGDWRNPEDLIRAGKQAVMNIRSNIQQGLSFNQETTLCGRSILSSIRLARSRGYYIEMYYIGLSSADIAVERVKKRALEGGHDIPEADIRRRYVESFRGLKTILPYCDRVELYDNSEAFRRIAVYEAGAWDVLEEQIPDWCREIV